MSKSVVKDFMKDKRDKTANKKSEKNVKTIVDYFKRKSGEITSNASKINSDEGVDVQDFTVKGKVTEIKNVFELMMVKGGDTLEKTPRKRLKRLGNASAKKEKFEKF